MKNYEVEMLLKCTVVVMAAESETDAYEVAETEVMFGDCELYESTAREISGKVDLESSRRHADKVVEAEQ